MTLFDVAMTSLLFAGLAGAAVFGVTAFLRRRAVWLVVGSISLALGSIPLLLGGIGVLGIALSIIMLASARALPGYQEARWVARSFAAVCLGVVLFLQYSGARRGNVPSTVDWILVGLALVMFAITIAPTRPPRGSAARPG